MDEVGEKEVTATTASPRTNDGRVTFMHLSAELRNKIYVLALVHKKPLLVKRCGAQSVRHEAKMRERGKKVKCRFKFTTPACKKEGNLAGLTRDTINVSLIKANKIINDEASVVLLRENTLIFEKASVLYDFCVALGIRAKSLGRVKVKDVSYQFANEHICILSRVEEPKSIALNTIVRWHGAEVGAAAPALSPSMTWEFIKPVVWRFERPLSLGMSFRPTESLENQRRRLDAFVFGIGVHRNIIGEDGKLETVDNGEECETRFKSLVAECWRKEATLVGVRRKREATESSEDLRGGELGTYA